MSISNSREKPPSYFRNRTNEIEFAENCRNAGTLDKEGRAQRNKKKDNDDDGLDERDEDILTEKTSRKKSRVATKSLKKTKVASKSSSKKRNHQEAAALDEDVDEEESVEPKAVVIVSFVSGKDLPTVHSKTVTIMVPKNATLKISNWMSMQEFDASKCLKRLITNAVMEEMEEVSEEDRIEELASQFGEVGYDFDDSCLEDRAPTYGVSVIQGRNNLVPITNDAILYTFLHPCVGKPSKVLRLAVSSLTTLPSSETTTERLSSNRVQLAIDDEVDVPITAGCYYEVHLGKKSSEVVKVRVLRDKSIVTEEAFRDLDKTNAAINKGIEGISKREGSLLYVLDKHKNVTVAMHDDDLDGGLTSIDSFRVLRVAIDIESEDKINPTKRPRWEPSPRESENLKIHELVKVYWREKEYVYDKFLINSMLSNILNSTDAKSQVLNTNQVNDTHAPVKWPNNKGPELPLSSTQATRLPLSVPPPPPPLPQFITPAPSPVVDLLESTVGDSESLTTFFEEAEYTELIETFKENKYKGFKCIRRATEEDLQDMSLSKPAIRAVLAERKEFIKKRLTPPPF